jgi:hypothetical protein
VRSLKTYRAVSALLALSLVLTAAMPLVRPSCGMTLAEMAEKPCCKGKAGHHDAPAMPSHDDAMAHGALSEATPPCHDAPAPETPETPCPETPDWLALQATCCSNVEAPTAPALERVQPLQANVLALVAAFVAPPAPAANAHAPPTSGFSPPAPVALHVLYGSFLT